MVDQQVYRKIVNMKLYPLIYTNEGARTAQESLSKNVVAVNVLSEKVVLFDKTRVIEQIKKQEVPFAHDREEFDAWMKAMKNVFANRAIVGMVSYDSWASDLYKVGASAGVSSFGPLTYQIVMKAISPGWLMSDISLTSHSEVVWQKMYELSEKGVYERKWLGDWDSYYITERGLLGDNKAIQEYIEKLDDGTLDKSEKAFLDWTSSSIYLKPVNYGWFWAYRKTSHDPLIDDMFEQGNQFMNQTKEEFNIRPGDLMDIIEDSSNKFFKRRYHHY